MRKCGIWVGGGFVRDGVEWVGCTRAGGDMLPWRHIGVGMDMLPRRHIGVGGDMLPRGHIGIGGRRDMWSVAWVAKAGCAVARGRGGHGRSIPPLEHGSGQGSRGMGRAPERGEGREYLVHQGSI